MHTHTHTHTHSRSHTHTPTQPDSGHFGTPFSHKHFNEKYQRNCFRNCFICHKQNACQIFFMPAMAATAAPPTVVLPSSLSTFPTASISFLPLPLSRYFCLCFLKRVLKFSACKKRQLFQHCLLPRSLSCCLSLFSLLCCIFSFWYFN